MNQYYATFREKTGVQCFKNKWSDMDNMAMNKNKGSIFKINAFTNQRILWLCVFYTYMFTSVFEASKRSPGLYM